MESDLRDVMVSMAPVAYLTDHDIKLFETLENKQASEKVVTGDSRQTRPSLVPYTRHAYPGMLASTDGVVVV